MNVLFFATMMLGLAEPWQESVNLQGFLSERNASTASHKAAANNTVAPIAGRPVSNASGLGVVTDASEMPATVDSLGAATFSFGQARMRLRGAFNNTRFGTIAGEAGDDGARSYFGFVWFGVLYYFLIVRQYPSLANKEGGIPGAAVELQQKNEVFAVRDVSCANNFHACCCFGPRAAHTFHSTGVLDYWPSCVLMSIFPCFMLWATNSFTDLNKKLGGEKDGCIKGCACAMCCSCCMIAKDAQTLDLITGAKTKLFNVAPPPNRM